MLVRRLARPMLAAVFVAGGADTLKAPRGRAELAEPVAVPLARRLPAPLPEDPVALVRLNAAVQVAAGLALATGRLPRVAAAVLAASLVPTTLAGHRFWEADPAARKQQQLHFTKNVAILGGLLIAAADTGGRPSVAWRARHAVQGLGSAVQGQPATGVRRVLAAVTA
jgi:putative oxidoreductase